MTEDATETRELENAPARPRRLLSTFVALLGLASALPVVLLCVATVTGLGLQNNLLPVIALFAGLLVTAIPARGVASLLGGGVLSHAFGFWVWSSLVMMALPGYSRDNATTRRATACATSPRTSTRPRPTRSRAVGSTCSRSSAPSRSPS